MRILLVLAALLAAVYARKYYHGYHLLEVVPKNKYQVDTLRKLWLTRDDLDFWLEPSVPGSRVHVMVEPELVAELSWVMELNGMRVKILDDDVQMMIEEELLKLLDRPEDRAFNYDQFNTYDDMMTELQTLADNCDVDGEFSCATGVLGASTEGREVRYLEIVTEAGNPTILIDSLTHAREWLSAATVFNIIRILLDQHPTYTDGKAYAQRYNWVFVPLVNPDGYDFSWTDDRLWRKSRKENPDSQCMGTDLNRNFDYKWSTLSSNSPCSDTYHGEFAADNPETQIMQDLAQALQPFAMLSFHCYGQYWLEPYGDGTYTDNRIEHSEVTDATCAAIEATFDTRWACGNSADVLYGTSGTTADYMRGVVESVKFAWTPELRGPGFIVDPDQIDPSTQEIWNGLKAKMDHPSFVP